MAGPFAYADHWSAYATTTPDFPPLPPFDLDQEILSYSIDSYVSSCTPLQESPLFMDSSIPIGLFEEIFLRFFHLFFCELSSSLLSDFQQANWILASRFQFRRLYEETAIDTAVQLSYKNPSSARGDGTIQHQLFRLLSVIPNF